MNKSKSEKGFNKKIVGMVLAIMVIAILFIPAYASYEIEKRTVTNILTVEGLYENGTAFETLEPVNQAHFESMFWGEIKTGESPNNDSVYVKVQGLEYVYYSNFVSYIGNGTYAVTPNYTIHTTPFTLRWIAVPMNVTTHQLAEYDFLRLTTDSKHAWNDLVYRYFGANYIYFDEIRNDTFMIINSLGTKSQLLSAPDEPVYIFFTGIDDTDVVFNFKFEGFNLNDEHQFYWQDEHLVFGSVGVSLSVMIMCALFTTNFIDVKFDKVKNGRRKRG